MDSTETTHKDFSQTVLFRIFFAKYLGYSSNTHNLTLCNNNNNDDDDDDDDDDDKNNHDNNIIVIFRLAFYITKILMFL